MDKHCKKPVKSTRNWLTTYVVTRVDKDYVNREEHRLVVGTYASRGDALTACTGYIMERLEAKDYFSFCMAHDPNHPEIGDCFYEDDSCNNCVVESKRKELVAHIRDILGGDGCYIVDGDDEAFRFDVDEADLEGEAELNTAIVAVSGYDAEVTYENSPEPHSFWSVRAMNSWIREYLKDYWAHELNEEIPPGILKEFMSDLKDFGLASLPIRDDLEIHIATYTHSIGEPAQKENYV